METEFGMISSQTEKEEAMRQIAQDLGLEDDYVPPVESTVNDDEEAYAARLAVQTRYTELFDQCEIREDPDWDDPWEKMNAELNAYLEGEDTIYPDVENKI